MRSRSYVTIPLLCILGCAGTDEVATSDSSTVAAESAVRAHTASFDAAMNAQDIDAMMALYPDGAVRMNPNVPPSVGKDEIRALFLEEWRLNEIVVANTVSDVRVAGALAVSRGTFTATMTPRDGGDPLQDRGKWSATYERQLDGSWKSIWEIWSSDLPPQGN